MTKNYGMQVKLAFTPASGLSNMILHNVTEIHYCYPTTLGKKVGFESDVHSTGSTLYVLDIKEMEITPEETKAEKFSELLDGGIA